MKSRNFKIRIKNLQLKETFILEYGATGYDIYTKYDKLLITQGFSMVDHMESGKNTKTYIYYPANLEIKYRKEQRAKNRTKSGKPRPRRIRPITGGYRIRPRRIAVAWRLPELEVKLEITMLTPTPKYKV